MDSYRIAGKDEKYIKLFIMNESILLSTPLLSYTPLLRKAKQSAGACESKKGGEEKIGS